MSATKYDYDSTAVRREARKFKKCSEMLEQRAMPQAKSIGAQLDGNFRGQAADALDERLSQMQSQIRSLRARCDNMYSVLMKYADELERLDAEFAQMLGG